MRPLRALLLLLFAIASLAGPTCATWTILIVDTRTGEMAIGSATCLTGIDLRALTPVVVVGKGIAVAQAFEHPQRANLLLINRELQAGTPPARIIQLLSQMDSQHSFRQYAIVDTSGQVAMWDGPSIMGWSGHRTGTMDSLVYAISGNLLTGEPVVTAIENAVRSTPGPLAQKLMAGMQAARSMGGDGRCSCDPRSPERCGSPPPPGFARSANIGYMIVARQGDNDGPCDPLGGCAQGTYYMNLNVANAGANSPDPVDVLQQQFDAWWQSLDNRPDHHNTVVQLDNDWLPSDGRTSTTARIHVRNQRGQPLGHGGAAVFARLDRSSTTNVTIGQVTDRGNGWYTFPVRTDIQIGLARLWIVISDGNGQPVLLSPRTEIRVYGRRLWAATQVVSTRAGHSVEFVYNPGAAWTGARWMLLASASGSSPGIPVGPGLILPLNPDAWLTTTYLAALAGYPPLTGTVPQGSRVVTRFAFPPGAYGLPVGAELTFAATIVMPFGSISNPLTIGIVP